ncbi:MAG: cation transporting ATPase C-terminal domain-containing protein [Sporocytophaga sp.]|uniref:cation transporting ATPase C-terminal domain-containing protein n=1 Tax=Sporocytophaga sp. TaxID=2231183 RepID=UPI001B21BB20|nr:cation transporting ATPase C-terminal domain-containing protein [Sporocytophaga sp.]MBO9701751.1 cation transporting ATPase C-terminal domain-containing protein [Sporocytophaga sp.]
MPCSGTYFRANTVETQSLFQSGWFIEGLFSQTIIVHVIRTSKIPFVESWASPQLLFTTLLVLIAAIYIPFSPIGTILGFHALPPVYFLYLIALIGGYMAITQVIKTWLIRKYGFS